MVKNLPAMRKTWVQSLNWEDPLEEGMATHSSILAWRIPMDRADWGLLYMRSQKVGHDRVTKHSRVVKNPPANAGDIRGTSWIPGLRRPPEREHGNLLQYSCLENLDRGAW